MAMLQTKRERFLMSLTAFAVVFGGGFLFVGKPLYAIYADLDNQIARTKTTWDEKKESFVNSEKLRARFEKSREALTIEGSEAEKRQKILQDLTTLFEETSIVPQSSQMNSVERVHDEFVVYSFSAKSIQTDWPTLARLLYEIDNSDAVLEVSRMTVKRTTRRPGFGQERAPLTVDIDISRLVEDQVKRRPTRTRGR